MVFTNVAKTLPRYGVEVLLLWENANPYPRKRWITIGNRTSTDKNGEHYQGEPEGASGHRPYVVAWMVLPDAVTADEVKELEDVVDFTGAD
jgi:hypothetical protein